MTEQRISVPGEADRLSAVTEFLQRFWSAHALPPAAAMSFELALEEIFMNVVMHGAAAGAVAAVDISVLLGDGRVTLTVEDDCPAFNPLTLPPPDVSAKLEDRRVGGLGVFLVRQMMDSVQYRRIGRRNQLRMVKQVAHHPDEPKG